MNGKPSAEALSLAGDQFIGMPYDQMDCQAFVEKCMQVCGVNMDLPGSNAWYRKMTWVGSPEECRAKFGTIPKGAILYILGPSGNEPEQYRVDGIGNASHMGIYIGRLDGAIHSSKSRGGVAYSKFSGVSINGGWNRVGLWDRFDYGEMVNMILCGNQTVEPAVNTEGVSAVDRAIVRSANGYGVNMRSEKSTGNNPIMKIPEGAEVLVVNDDGVWSSVEYEGKHGYAMSMYLMKETTPETAEFVQSPVEYVSEGEIVHLSLEKTVALKLYDALGAALSEEILHG